jgi:predicted DNA binding CopG/RHH family protein
MTTGKPLEQMTEEEEAEYFYANREEFERNAKTPVSLERVVSTRFSEDELKHIGEAADAAGMKLSTYIRKAAVEAAGIPQPAGDAAGLAGLHADLLAALARVEDMEKKVTEHGRVGRSRSQDPVSSEACK